VSDYSGEEPIGTPKSVTRVKYTLAGSPAGVRLSFNQSSQPDFVPLTQVQFAPDANGRIARADLLERGPDGAPLEVGSKEVNSLGEVHREREIDGTITRITRNSLGYDLRTYVGTRDTAWTDPPPSPREFDDATYNMILLDRTEYGTGVNDAWLPTVTRRYDTNPAWSTDHYGSVAAEEDLDSYATVTTYDWRMRPVRVDSYDKGNPATADRLSTTLTFLDHLDRPTLVVVYGPGAPSTVELGGLDPSLLVDNDSRPSAQEFFDQAIRPIAISESFYGPDGTAYEQRVYDMAWTFSSTGEPPYHATYQYTGRGGQTVYTQRPGQPIQITRLDGVARVSEIKSVLPESLADFPGTPDGYELTKTEYRYDPDGNAVDVLRWERVIDDFEELVPDPILSLSNSVRSRTINWYDVQKRLVATAELGTEHVNGTYQSAPENYERTLTPTQIPVISVESSGLGVVWPSESDDPEHPDFRALVSLSFYDDEGNQTYTRNPAGRVTEFKYTGSGRMHEKIENRFGSPAQQRTTKYVHQYGRLVEMASRLDVSDVDFLQTTKVQYVEVVDIDQVPHVYGAEIVDENFAPVSMNNALVRELQFPPTGGTGPNTTLRFRYTFSNQIAERIDSRGVVFRYHYDAYGRIDVIQVGWYDGGTGGDFTPGYPSSMTLVYGAPADRVSRVEYEYDDANRVSWVRSKNEQGQLVTSNKFDLDERGNLLSDWQAIGGDVVSNTPRLQYEWDYEPTDALAARPGHLRPVSMKYPQQPVSQARTILFEYGAADSVNDRLSRIGKLRTRVGTGAWSDLVSFGYTGVARRASLGYGGGTSATGGEVNQSYRISSEIGLAGLDMFGRVKDLHFVNGVGSTPETMFRGQYTYDKLGNRVTNRLTQAPVGVDLRDNVLSQLNTYDELNRLRSTEYGELGSNSGTGGAPVITSGTRYRADEWTLDLLGNWVGDGASTPGRFSEGDLDGYGTPWARPWADSAVDEQSITYGVNNLNQITSLENDGDGAGPWVLGGEATPTYDAAGNMVSDGRYYYQYDAWNRVVQINYAISPESLTGPPQPIEPGLLVKHYTYDGVGRLVRTQSPHPSPEAMTGLVRTERFYYDGVRRVQELISDPVSSLMEAAASSDPGLQQLVSQTTSSSGEPLDPSTAPGPLEQGQIESAGGPTDPPPVTTELAFEYVWGLGDNGLDELLVKFDKVRKRWWVIQDSGGDVVAIVNPGSGSTPIADVAGQWVYDAYGDVIVADHILAFPVMRIGHKGLFIDRLDVPVVNSGGMESPRLVPFGHTISHNRNRLYSPQMGRFYQLDPNATAMALLEASIYHGKGVGAIALAFSMEQMYGDGLNLYEYLGSNPWNRSDPMGLSWDPFDMVDEFIALDAGSKAAFLQAVGMSAKATAVVAATIASYLPIPGLASAGDLALFALGEQGAGETAVALSLGIIPGGKLAKLFATSGIGKLLGGITSSAWSGAKHFAKFTAAGMLAKTGGTMLDIAKKLLQKGCGCFEAGTEIWTERGLIPVEQIQVGDLVLAQNEATGETEMRMVIETFKRDGAPIVQVSIRFEDGRTETFRTTEEHPFWVPEIGWVGAQSLQPGSLLWASNGLKSEVRAVRFTGELETVYNIEVEGLHNYFVGQDGILVHNNPCKVIREWYEKQVRAIPQRALARSGGASIENARWAVEERNRLRNVARDRMRSKGLNDEADALDRMSPNKSWEKMFEDKDGDPLKIIESAGKHRRVDLGE
jgi:YD repeat-containing protein